ncbi:epimerase [Pseudomonas sp. PIC25]|uniref:SDR family oxidoreductase n=1 Tax=Pseudomonas sp. PIC25 TaxID=1958773 RepID=UPI000BAB4FDA|nr:SDR family oxidoreductase [Pseudomonas sp. PIC25]PAU56752.1 epimerase [Pseudomonas sp. PIC25]
MRILLVGASGFIGRRLLEALRSAGHQVVATARRPRADAFPDVEWRALDLARLSEDSTHFPWPAGVELVINAAGILGSDAAELARVQDSGARCLFDLAAAHCARVLQFSALGAGEQPDIPFLASKAAADAYLLGLGIPAVVLRPSLVLGEGGASSGWFSRLSPWPLIPLLDTRARVQPLHVDDLVGAVLALLRCWPEQPMVLPLVGPEPMTQPQLIDRLRAAQGWGPARYLRVPAALAAIGARVGALLGWRALNPQTVRLARRDNLASAESLEQACGFRAASLTDRLHGWPNPLVSVTAALRPLLLASLVLVWLGTALVCLGPGYGWGLRLMGEAGVSGWLASLAVIGGALLDGLLGVGLLLPRWRRWALRGQLALMLGYMLLISLLLPHYWFDPYGAVLKNLVLMVATLWLLWTESAGEKIRR